MKPPLTTYSNDPRPAVRWWWFANTITYSEIDGQLDWLAENGFGRVELAWIYPTKPELPPEEFLGNRWAALVLHAARGCAARGLGCDYTLGTLWPFGGLNVGAEEASRRWDGPSPQRLARSWEQAYGEPGFILDHLDESALERYVATIRDALREAIAATPSPALFTDSWEVDPQGLWAADFGGLFRKRFGYDLVPFMERIDEHPQERYDYRLLLSQLVLDQFFRPLTRLSNEAGALARVQAHGAPCDLIDAYALADIPESETMLFDPHFASIAASAAAMEANPLVSCETFTCMYGWEPHPKIGPHHGEEDIGDLKLVADAGFANGVTMVVWHGMPFNGPDSDNRFYATTHVGPDAAFAPSLPEFNAYLTRVSRALREGQTLSEVAVYLPTEEAFMRGELPPELHRPSARWHWEMQYARLPAELRGYRPIWTNASRLCDAVVRDGRVALGEVTVGALFVDTEWLPYDVVADLVRLATDGGSVLLSRRPREPGTIVHDDYDALLDSLVERSLDSVPIEPLVEAVVAEGNHAPALPEFWCRRIPAQSSEDSQEIWRYFFAHPGTADITYPLEYQVSRRLGPVRLAVRIAGPSGYHEAELAFEPGAAILLDVDSNGVSDRSPGHAFLSSL